MLFFSLLTVLLGGIIINKTFSHEYSLYPYDRCCQGRLCPNLRFLVGLGNSMLHLMLIRVIGIRMSNEGSKVGGCKRAQSREDKRQRRKTKLNKGTGSGAPG